MSTQQQEQDGAALEIIIPLNKEEVKAKFIEQITKADKELETVTLGVTEMGPWSNSKYKSLKKCPFQYYLKYILKFKIPEALQTQSDPLSANVGKATHLILEHIMCGKSVEKSYSLARKDFVDKNILTPEQWVEKVEALNHNISSFKEKMIDFERSNPSKRVFTEIRIGLTRQYEQTGFFSDDVWLRGIIDLVLLLDSFDAIILDHKTGGGQGGTKYYQEQLDWYKVLFYFGVEQVNGVQTGVHFIQEGEVKMDSYSINEDIKNNLKNSLEMSLEGAIDGLKEIGYFKHIRSNQCKWCEYDNAGCKSGELKNLELSTKRWIEIKNG
jgi:hypothetical protein